MITIIPEATELAPEDSWSFNAVTAGSSHANVTSMEKGVETGNAGSFWSPAVTAATSASTFAEDSTTQRHLPQGAPSPVNIHETPQQIDVGRSGKDQENLISPLETIMHQTSIFATSSPGPMSDGEGHPIQIYEESSRLETQNYDIEEEEDPCAPSDEEDFHDQVQARRDLEEPGRLVLHKLKCAHITSPQSASLVAPPRYPPTEQALGGNVPSLPSPMLSLSSPPEPDSSVHPQTMSQFHRLQLQAKLQTRKEAKLSKVKKYQDRLVDVQGYKKLWKDFVDLQSHLKKKSSKKQETADVNTETRPTKSDRKRLRRVRRSRSFDLQDSSFWYFDFQNRDLAFEGPAEVCIEQPGTPAALKQPLQSSLSLLSESSMEAQRRFFSEKRRQRKRSKQSKYASKTSGSVVSAPSGSIPANESSVRYDYGPVKTSNTDTSLPLTEMEVSFVHSSPEQPRPDDASLVSDLDDDNVSYRSNDYRVVRRRVQLKNMNLSATEKITALEERLKQLKEKEVDIRSVPMSSETLINSGGTSSLRNSVAGNSGSLYQCGADRSTSSKSYLNVVSLASPLPSSHLTDRFNDVMDETPKARESNDFSTAGNSIIQVNLSGDVDDRRDGEGVPLRSCVYRKDAYGVSSFDKPDQVENGFSFDSYSTNEPPGKQSLDGSSLAEPEVGCGHREVPGAVTSSTESSPLQPSSVKSTLIYEMSTQEFLRISEENALEKAARLEHNELRRPDTILGNQREWEDLNSRESGYINDTSGPESIDHSLPPSVCLAGSETELSFPAIEAWATRERVTELTEKEPLPSEYSLSDSTCIHRILHPDTAAASLLLANSVEAQVQDVLSKYRDSAQSNT